MPFKMYTEAQLATAVTRYVLPKPKSYTGLAALVLVVWVASLFLVRGIRPEIRTPRCVDVPVASTLDRDTFVSAEATE